MKRMGDLYEQAPHTMEWIEASNKIQYELRLKNYFWRQPMSEQQSPLLEAAPDSLNELFNRDPLQLSTQDIDRIIVEMRAQRARIALAEAAGKRTPKAKKAEVKDTEIDLTDLGF